VRGPLAIASKVGTATRKPSSLVHGIRLRDVALLASSYGPTSPNVYSAPRGNESLCRRRIYFSKSFPDGGSGPEPHVQRNDDCHSLVVLAFLMLSRVAICISFIVIPWRRSTGRRYLRHKSLNWLYACEQIVLIWGSRACVEAQPGGLGRPISDHVSKLQCLQRGVDCRRMALRLISLYVSLTMSRW